MTSSHDIYGSEYFKSVYKTVRMKSRRVENKNRNFISKTYPKMESSPRCAVVCTLGLKNGNDLGQPPNSYKQQQSHQTSNVCSTAGWCQFSYLLGSHSTLLHSSLFVTNKNYYCYFIARDNGTSVYYARSLTSTLCTY